MNDKKIVLNYTEHLLILNFTVTGYVSISVFPLLVGVPIGIQGLNICAITTGIKKYKWIIKKKKKKKNVKMILLAKSKSNSIEWLISNLTEVKLPFLSDLLISDAVF